MRPGNGTSPGAAATEPIGSRRECTVRLTGSGMLDAALDTMPGPMISVLPACWSFGSGFATNEPTIGAGRKRPECRAPTPSESTLGRVAAVWTLLPIGAFLQGTYRLDHVPAVRSTASVFAATHLRNTNCVAVKIPHPEIAKSSGIRSRLWRDGNAANSVGYASCG